MQSGNGLGGWKVGASLVAAVLAIGAGAGCGSDGTEAGSGEDGSSTSAATGTGNPGVTTGPGTSGGGEQTGSTGDGPPSGELTDEDRIAFLHYYSPVIFKKADETAGSPGRDWLTNFDFDRDGWSLANNRDNWLSGLDAFVAGTGNATWQVRPTLYSAAVQFEAEGRTNLVLLFHVYHAEQGSTELEDIVPEAGSIHDWERIEIRIDGVTREPGGGEVVRYVTITEHSNHRVRLGSDPELNFMQTGGGMHPMIFQAEHSDPLGVGFAELRFVTDSFETVMARPNAEVNVAGAEDQNFHYIFVSEGDPDAVDQVGALALTSCTAIGLASRESGGVGLASVPRIAFELQDLADLFVTHWDSGVPNVSWGEPIIDMELDDPIVDERGIEEVPAGRQQFYSQAFDDLDSGEDRRGYPRKHWFWGAYKAGADGDYGDGFRAASRCVANGRADCADNYWAQHDYFAHEGTPGDGTLDGEPGGWLLAGWHIPENGGFDGRWVQLFADERPDPCR